MKHVIFPVTRICPAVLFTIQIDKERSSWYFNEIPGSFSKGYQLAFLNKEPSSRNGSVNSSEKDNDTIDKILPVKPASAKSENQVSTGALPANNLDNKIIHLKNFIENMQRN